MTDQPAPEATPEPAAQTPAPSEPSMRERVSSAPEAFAVPEAFADKPWAGNIKSQEDLYNQFDNLQGMIGKKSIPGEGATDEEWQEFHSKLRPETVDGYELNLPEGVEAEINADIQGEYKKLFHDIGLTSKQAQALFEGDLSIRQAQLEAETKSSNDEFVSMMQETYGDKAEDAIKIARTELAGVGQEALDALDSSSNAVMKSVIDILNQNHSKYSREDTPHSEGETSTAPSIEDKVAEANKLRTSVEAKDPFNTDNKATLARLAQLDEEIKKAYK